MTLQRTRKAHSTVQPEKAPSESDVLEVSLRPRLLKEYVGQAKTKEHLLVHIGAAKNRQEPLGHVLLHGPPGLGKTTLAHIIAQEMQSNIRVTSGPTIEKPGDLASLLTNLEAGDVLFIDEIHRLRPVVEEVLYGAMEDYALDIMIGKGPTARSVRLTLKPFTLVGATTKIGAISAPLRDRFLHHFKLQFYSRDEMQRIIRRSAEILGVAMEHECDDVIAGASRATPRIANRLVRSMRDFSQVRGEERVSKICVLETLASLDIDHEGLDGTDRQLLTAIIDSFGGGPVGLSTLAAVLAEEEETIEDVYEPYLMQQGYLQRTPKGRMVLRKAYEKIGRTLPDGLVQAAML
jgi:holliday junction DNA helicase RuvB